MEFVCCTKWKYFLLNETDNYSIGNFFFICRALKYSGSGGSIGKGDICFAYCNAVNLLHK